MSSDNVIWHDLECGAYRADLPLWQSLAAANGGAAVLELGAGTGRVALDLARAGHHVIAIERDADLVAELADRVGDLPVRIIRADACDFRLETPVGLCVVAMQTVQLFADRGAFLRCALAALAPRGVLAMSLLGADTQPFEVELDPDTAQHHGIRYASAPVALRESAETVVIERRRTAGTEHSSLDTVALARIEPETMIFEATAAGFERVGVLSVPATVRHSGSQVVVVEAPGQ